MDADILSKPDNLIMSNIVGKIYRILYGVVFDRPTNFGWVVPGKIAASGQPYSVNEIKFLYNEKIRSILSLTEEPISNKLLDLFDFDYMHISVPDHDMIKKSDLQTAIEFMNNSVLHHKAILVHCHAGKGRTGTVLARYFNYYDEMDIAESIVSVRNNRHGSIEPKQEEGLKKYYIDENNSRF